MGKVNEVEFIQTEICQVIARYQSLRFDANNERNDEARSKKPNREVICYDEGYCLAITQILNELEEIVKGTYQSGFTKEV